jgi:lipopolysaccharide/colanic/teichoic acid biosynthesis glycosyltransferase
VSNRELFTLVGRNLNERTGHAVAYYALRSTVPPGMTGWAQVRYRYANNLEEEMEKLQYDLYYVKYRSRSLDVKILCATLKVVLFGSRQAAQPAAGPADHPAPVFNPHNTTLTT